MGRPPCITRKAISIIVGGILWVLALPLSGLAQGTSGPTVSDSRVGYIDSAIPADQLRFRFDDAMNDRRPSLAEFFWPRSGPLGPGPRFAERGVDYQDLSAYGEVLLGENLSAFVELPVRFLNPEINANASGLGDMNAGFKWAFYRGDDTVGTFQFRTYAPSGDPNLGLGNGHASLEPAFLLYQRLTPALAFEGELRYWLPVGGTDFAGNIIRYGVGLNYNLWQDGGCYIAPVAEMVGWTILSGHEGVLPPSGVPEVEPAAGDTIINVKFGVRAGLGSNADVYIGYGRPLTGNRWYENIVRVELRLHF
jgi:hypothetical protein